MRNRNRKPNQHMSNKQCAQTLKGRDSKDDKSYNHDPSSSEEKAFNDPDWYVNSEQILKDSARIPYSIPVGTCFKREGRLSLTDEAYHLPDFDASVPGIMVSYLMPTLGCTDQGPTAAVNVAANSLFQNVRAHISGSRKYEAVDMMIYMGCMDSVYSYVTWLTRLYATVFTYHQSNRYLSRALVEAQNVDYDDLVSKLPQFRMMINVELAKTRAMYLPSVMPIFKRHSWMFSHYFIEGDSEKDQIYCHSMAGYHRFTLDDNGKGAMDSVCICQSPDKLDVAHLVQILRGMIDPIFEREDFNIISGDLLRTYEGNVFTLTEIPDIATIQLANSEEVLLQFKNAKYKAIPHESDLNPYQWARGFFDYRQDDTSHLIMRGDEVKSPLYYYITADSTGNEYRKYNADAEATKVMKGVAYEWSRDIMLTTPHHNVEPVENMINTRLTLAFDIEPNDQTGWGAEFDMSYFGSEWPVFYRIFTYKRDKSTQNITLMDNMYDFVLRVNKDFIHEWTANQEPIRSAFKYLPELSIITETTALSIWMPERTIFEVDNYALINSLTLSGLHYAAILGEYNIPNLSIGK